MFDEAWRINRDNFYDPGMHGADWPAIRKKYAAFLPDLATRSDLYRVIRWMLSELSVGHSYLMPGEPLDQRRAVPGGLLGADYEVANGRYRFKKVYGGLNWSRELRSPLTAPGVDVKAGEYLLAVRGVELKPPTELFSLFENTAEKSIEITVGPNPDGKGSRTVTVEPLASEDALRNRDWVEGNLRRVHEATGGRAAYVYVPDTAGRGHEYFKRYFYPQSRQGGDHHRRAIQRRRPDRRLLHQPSLPPAAVDVGDALRRGHSRARRRHPRPEGHAHRRDGRLRRRHAPLDVPQAAARHAGRQADLGRAGRHPRLAAADGRHAR